MKVTEITSEEYHPYFRPYIDKVGNLSLMEALKAGEVETVLFFKSIPHDKHKYRYAEGKWTIKDILLHIIDSERAFSYRAMNFARSKNCNLEGFDENVFVDTAQANVRTLSNLLDEYSAVRKSTIQLFATFSNEALKSYGKANNTLLSVRAAGFLICGHELHHKHVITERYL